MNRSKTKKFERFAAAHRGQRHATDLWAMCHRHDGAAALNAWRLASGWLRDDTLLCIRLPYGVAIHPERRGGGTIGVDGPRSMEAK